MLIKYSGKYIEICFNSKITFLPVSSVVYFFFFFSLSPFSFTFLVSVHVIPAVACLVASSVAFCVISSVSFVFLFFFFFFLHSVVSFGYSCLFLFLFFLSFLISSVSWYLPLVVSWCSFGLSLRLCLLFVSSLVLFFPF